MPTKPLSHSEIALHWIVGIGMIMLIGVGMYMTRNEVLSMYPLHKSIGTLMLIFVVIRAVIRLRKGWPEPVGAGQVWAHRLSRIVHWVLIIGTLAMPLSGIAMSVGGGHGLTVFGLDLIGANIGADGRPEPLNEAMAGAGGAAHGIWGRLLILAIVLHVVGALKHHFVDKDSTLRRMLGRA